MNELQDACSRREAFQNTFQFAMIAGKLLVAARVEHEELAGRLERSALIMLRLVLESNDQVNTRKGQQRIIRALATGFIAEEALLALKERKRLRVLGSAALEALERAMRSLKDEVV